MPIQRLEGIKQRSVNRVAVGACFVGERHHQVRVAMQMGLAASPLRLRAMPSKSKGVTTAATITAPAASANRAMIGDAQLFASPPSPPTGIALRRNFGSAQPCGRVGTCILEPPYA